MTCGIELSDFPYQQWYQLDTVSDVKKKAFSGSSGFNKTREHEALTAVLTTHEKTEKTVFQSFYLCMSAHYFRRYDTKDLAHKKEDIFALCTLNKSQFLSGDIGLSLQSAVF